MVCSAAWTVNTTEDMKRLMDLGVDGIISDYPTRLRTVMEERGLKLPRPTRLGSSNTRSSNTTKGNFPGHAACC